MDLFNNLFELSVSPWNLVLRTIVVYSAILALLRLAGRKHMSQLGPTEFVAMLLISNAVQNSMNAGDNSLLGGLISASTLIALSYGISYVTYRSEKISDLIEGKQILLVNHGKLQHKALEKIMMTEGQLRAQLMLQGLDDLTKLNCVVMDSEGRLLVMHQLKKTK